MKFGKHLLVTPDGSGFEVRIYAKEDHGRSDERVNVFYLCCLHWNATSMLVM